MGAGDGGGGRGGTEEGRAGRRRSGGGAAAPLGADRVAAESRWPGSPGCGLHAWEVGAGRRTGRRIPWEVGGERLQQLLSAPSGPFPSREALA